MNSLIVNNICKKGSNLNIVQQL